MRPYERHIHISDINLLMVQALRIDIEVHHDDTVATVDVAGHGVTINTRIFEEARSTALRQTEAQRVSLTDIVIDNGRINHMIPNE